MKLRESGPKFGLVDAGFDERAEDASTDATDLSARLRSVQNVSREHRAEYVAAEPLFSIGLLEERVRERQIEVRSHGVWLDRREPPSSEHADLPVTRIQPLDEGATEVGRGHRGERVLDDAARRLRQIVGKKLIREVAGEHQRTSGRPWRGRFADPVGEGRVHKCRVDVEGSPIDSFDQDDVEQVAELLEPGVDLDKRYAEVARDPSCRKPIVARTNTPVREVEADEDRFRNVVANE